MSAHVSGQSSFTATGSVQYISVSGQSAAYAASIDGISCSGMSSYKVGRLSLSVDVSEEPHIKNLHIKCIYWWHYHYYYHNHQWQYKYSFNFWKTSIVTSGNGGNVNMYGGNRGTTITTNGGTTTYSLPGGGRIITSGNVVVTGGNTSVMRF